MKWSTRAQPNGLRPIYLENRAMKKVISGLLISMLLLACSGKGSSTKAACGVDNPIEDLAWLKTYTQQVDASSEELSRYLSVVQGTYNGETVFIFDNCCPICSVVISVYDCEGKSIGLLNDTINLSEIKDTQIIYKPDDFTCSAE